MRIVIVSHYALPHVGGIEVAIAAVASRLAARGHDVVHIASGDPRDEATAGGAYRVVRVPAFNGPETAAGVPWPVFSPQLAPVIAREVKTADIVHGHGFLYMSSVGALLYARRRRVPRVITEHVGEVPYESRAMAAAQRAAISTIGRSAVRAAQAVVVLNEKVEREVARLAPGGPVVRIENGVDTELHRPAAPDERAELRARFGWDDRPRVLFVGRLVAKKGIDVALRAAERWGDTAELVAVGPGEPPFAPASNVRIMGSRPLDEVADLYRAADAFVLPSHGEGFPLSVQEAMASGLPVILADDPGYASYLHGSEAGATLVRREPDAVAAAVTALVQDEPARRSAGIAAAEHARRAFSLERAVGRHEELYRSVIAG